MGSNIVISGLTASGKTTHSQLLASSLGYEWFGASLVLKELLGVEGRYWLTDWDSARREGEIDRELDRRMVAEFVSRERTVFDAWALPWTSAEPALRVWLGSDVNSRARKVVVSRLRFGEPMLVADGRRVALEKDATSRALFRSQHGFDLFRDHEVFDLRFDLSALIAVPTVPASDVGIACFAPVLLHSVQQRLGIETAPIHLTSFQQKLSID